MNVRFPDNMPDEFTRTAPQQERNADVIGESLVVVRPGSRRHPPLTCVRRIFALVNLGAQ